jgi:hypothetical protein
MVEGIAAEPCWCTALPILPVGALPLSGDGAVAATCFCPDCLRAHISALQAEKR